MNREQDLLARIAALETELSTADDTLGLIQDLADRADRYIDADDLRDILATEDS